MYKILISLSLLTSSMSFAGYEEVKQELNERLHMYEGLLSGDMPVFEQWFLGGVIEGMENALLILNEDEMRHK